MCLLDSDFYTETYGAEYELKLSAWGEGILRESDLLDMQKPDEIIKKFKKRYRRYPRSISLLIQDPTSVGFDFFFTGVETALLEKLETLKELILSDSIADIEMTQKLEKILKENDTLIRGSFDSFAEKFALDNGLHFRPSDIIIAEYSSERPPESTRLTLVFKRNGSVYIKEDIRSPGTSCSNSLGGIFTHPLNNDFFNTETAEQIAGLFSKGLYNEILRNGRLETFIEKAKSHVYYKGKN